MPCYLFTYHGHATWMPDHRRGYVKRGRGIQKSDPDMAARYREKQREPAVRFGGEHQEVLIEAAKNAGPHLDAVVHTAACEPTHVHVLASWEHDRLWKSIRTSVRSAMSRALNEAFGKRPWFSDSPSRKRVRDHEHFDYLVLAYLPRHEGLCWVDPDTGKVAMARDAKRDISVAKRTKRKL